MTFWDLGYTVIKDFKHIKSMLPENMYSTGFHDYSDGEITDTEIQVPGATSRRCYPPYNDLHRFAMFEIEQLLGINLKPTYYFDRVYYTGNELQPHTDKPQCQVSVTLQLESTLAKPWKFYVEDLKGEVHGIDLHNGDAVIYQGCDVKHWREPMGGGKKDYHHMIFLHYVE